MEYVTLNNGVKMPLLGYGVFQVSQEGCERYVLDAIKTLDTGNSLFFSHQEASTVDFFVELINKR